MAVLKILFIATLVVGLIECAGASELLESLSARQAYQHEKQNQEVQELWKSFGDTDVETCVYINKILSEGYRAINITKCRVNPIECAQIIKDRSVQQRIPNDIILLPQINIPGLQIQVDCYTCTGNFTWKGWNFMSAAGEIISATGFLDGISVVITTGTLTFKLVDGTYITFAPENRDSLPLDGFGANCDLKLKIVDAKLPAQLESSLIIAKKDLGTTIRNATTIEYLNLFYKHFLLTERIVAVSFAKDVLLNPSLVAKIFLEWIQQR